MILFRQDYRTNLYLFAAGKDCDKIEKVDESGSFTIETFLCTKKHKRDFIDDIFNLLVKGEKVPEKKQDELYNILSPSMKGKNLVE